MTSCPDGNIAEQPGAHLDPTERLLRQKIVAAIEHEQAKGITAAEAVASYLREAAFTTLNRFVALKLLEARELVQECVSKGEQSSGFKEFCGLAPGLVALPDHGYRMYIESLFDEIGREVRILFDRRDPASLLWPRRQALLDLLDILNTPDLADVWKEDETIGWVYQYFNSDDERRQMRSESQAPRNSRELAVRNQFFTPRYVVEFLTDNTLGRIWYEMRQGMTELKNQCRYLVRRKDEVFLSWECRKSESKGAPVFTGADLLLSGTEESFPPFDDSEESINRLIQMAHCVNGYARRPFEDEIDGKWWPFWVKEQVELGKPLADFSTQELLDTLFGLVRADRHASPYSALLEESSTISIANEIRRRVIESRREDLSQEELLMQAVLVPFREKKDPRDLKILDPACGSGHFLLYAFDLLETIYIEGWHDEHAPDSEITGHTLQDDYKTLEDLQLAIPELIIRWNLHGIDIDQRAVQIAAAALWLRAQRSWQKLAIKAAVRPPIAKTNIVTAEPMPGEEEMRREFVRSLTPRVLGQLVEVVFR